MTDKMVYHEFQVEKAVAPAPGNAAPRYPDVLRQAGIEGEVLAQFVVDTSGVADISSLKVLRSTHDLFTQTVKSALPAMRFLPAQVGGKKVKQLVQMPFQFNLAQGTPQTKPLVVTGSLPAQAKSGRPAPQVLSLAPSRSTATGTGITGVDEQATLRPMNPAPRYPDELRELRVEGEVVAKFVVGADGIPDTSTFAIVRSTNDLFSEAVRRTIVQMRFNPAKLHGQPVKQLIEMPFQFNLAKTP